MLAAQTEKGRYVERVTDQLAQKGAPHEQVVANAADAKRFAGLEIRGPQAKLNEVDASH